MVESRTKATGIIGYGKPGCLEGDSSAFLLGYREIVDCPAIKPKKTGNNPEIYRKEIFNFLPNVLTGK